MKRLSVPLGHHIGEFETAARVEVPVLFETGGLCVTPSPSRPMAFAVTRVNTGVALHQALREIEFQSAVGACALLAEVGGWSVIGGDALFVQRLPRGARESLRDCVRAVAEMFGGEP